MAKKFISMVPKKPLLRRETYGIPTQYVDEYHGAGITKSDELTMLFYTTQFGGFRLRKIPSNMHFDEDFIKQWLKYEIEGRYHKFSANTNFLCKFGNLEIKPLQKIWRSVAVDSEAMYQEGFSLEEVFEASDVLSRLNEFYSSLRLDIQQPKSGISAEDRIKLSSFHGIPYFVKKPKAGGRLFHPENSYQRISSTLRQLLTINGERTAEIDLSAATMQFLNIALKKQHLPPLEAMVSTNGDPYQYFLSILNSQEVLCQYTERPIERETVKALLYTAIYSPENRREYHINRKLRLMGRQYTFKDLFSFFPGFFKALSALGHSTGRPMHIAIFKEESRYAQQVLKIGCLEDRLPILPLHDSFIVTESNIDGLKRVMDDAAIDLYGKHLVYKQKY